MDFAYPRACIYIDTLFGVGVGWCLLALASYRYEKKFRLQLKHSKTMFLRAHAYHFCLA